MLSRDFTEVPVSQTENKMASPPGGGDQGDSRDPILEIGAVLLKDFIYERVRRHGDSNTVVTRQQLGGGELCDPHLKELAHCLQQIGDELDGNAELQRMINARSLDPTSDMFIKVAREIFSDGKFNWGRVVALFYFACRLVIKALIKNIPDIIRTIITWTMDYLREHVANWIREQGGWEGIRSYFGTPTWQTLAVFLAGVLTAFLVIRKM
ncbi:apoptosis regulator BAX-like [Melanotaenia boesemani]|uniref:apoptosis regulator BAX-like n=1 Tax=Melanotaenia boesemani TaxID=1250792 RepID=UPI001C053DDB|nr:apoptosis regulator BAX-like [Melanotaenia boesemani]